MSRRSWPIGRIAYYLNVISIFIVCFPVLYVAYYSGICKEEFNPDDLIGMLIQAGAFCMVMQIVAFAVYVRWQRKRLEKENG